MSNILISIICFLVIEEETNMLKIMLLTLFLTYLDIHAEFLTNTSQASLASSRPAFFN